MLKIEDYSKRKVTALLLSEEYINGTSGQDNVVWGMDRFGSLGRNGGSISSFPPQKSFFINGCLIRNRHISNQGLKLG